jgi:hypothetical protein
LCTSSDLVEEFAEIDTNWKIDKNTLIQTGVVVSINGLDILQFGESSERVSCAHELFNRSMTLKSLNNEDNIVNLVPVEHHGDEVVQWVRRIRDEKLEFIHELFFHRHTEGLHLEFLALLLQEKIASVIGVFHHEFEFTDVACLFKLLVFDFREEALAEGPHYCFWQRIVEVMREHFHSCS